MKPQIPWLRVFVEGVVIVGSILLAFGIDAWWEGRQEREEELGVLTGLDAELTDAVAHLTDWRIRHQGVASAGREILAHTGAPGRVGLSPDSIGSLIWTVNFNWSADPPMGVLSSVISTGQLATIQSQDLRAALVRWDTDFRDLRGAEGVTAEMVYRRLIPFLEQHLAFRSVNAASVDPDLGSSAFPFGVQEVFANREFESIIANRVAFIDVVVGKYDVVLAGLESTRSLVKAELAARH